MWRVNQSKIQWRAENQRGPTQNQALEIAKLHRNEKNDNNNKKTQYTPRNTRSEICKYSAAAEMQVFDQLNIYGLGHSGSQPSIIETNQSKN